MVDKSGNKKLKPFPNREYRKRKTDYADLINLRTEVLLRKGKYTSLDSALSKNEEWMKKNLSQRSIAFRDHYYTKARREETKNDIKSATKYYELADKYTKYSKIEKTGIDIQRKLIAIYYSRNKLRESIKRRVKLERSAREFYGVNSLFYAKYRLEEVNQLYADGKFDRADKKLNNIYKLKTKFPDNHKVTSDLSNAKANIAIKNSNFDMAEDTLKKLLKIKALMYGAESPEYHKEKLRLADFYSNYTSNFGTAKDIQENSFTKIVAPQLSPQNIEYIKYMQQMAYTYDLVEKYDLSIKYLEQAADHIKTYYGKENLEYASDIEKLASVLIKKGDYVKAEELIKQAVNIFENNNDKKNALNKSETYLTLAKLYNTLGMYDEAEKALAKSSKYSKRAQKTQGGFLQAKSSDELAALYLQRGRYNEAEDLLNYTLDKKESKLGSSNRELIPTLNLLGDVYLITGNYSAAEKIIRRSMTLSDKIFTQNSIKYTESLELLELLYTELGDIRRAEETDKQILEIQKKQLGTNHVDVAATLTRLAMIKLYNGGEVKDIERLLAEALSIVKFNLGDKNPLYADQLKYYSYLFIETKRYARADSALDIANEIWVSKLGNKNINSADVAFLKGNISLLKGNYVSAQTKFSDARDLYGSIFSNSHPSYVKATSKLARAYYINKDYQKSLKMLNETTDNYLEFTKKYFPSLSFSEKAKFWAQIKEDFEFYNSLALKMKDKNPAIIGNIYNNVLATKAILLSSSIKLKQRILNSKDDALISKFNEWTSKKQLLVTALSMTVEARIAAEIVPSILEREVELLEKELSESSELFAENFEKKNASWKDVKKSLGENEYAIEITRFRLFDKNFSDSIIYAALVISNKSDKGPLLVTMTNGRDMERKYLKYYKNVVITKADDDYYSFENFWKPIKAVVPDQATLYISSDGVYNEINIESLKAEDGTFPIDKNPIILVSNTKDLIKRNSKKETKNVAASKVILIGNPTFYASGGSKDAAMDRGISKASMYDNPANQVIKQLPGTESEVNELNNLFELKGWQIKKYVKIAADEDSIKKMKSPKVLHIATHGYFNPV